MPSKNPPGHVKRWSIAQKGRWCKSGKFDCCRRCQTKDRPHMSRGYCARCYGVIRYAETINLQHIKRKAKRIRNNDYEKRRPKVLAWLKKHKAHNRKYKREYSRKTQKWVAGTEVFLVYEDALRRGRIESDAAQFAGSKMVNGKRRISFLVDIRLENGQVLRGYSTALCGRSLKDAPKSKPLTWAELVRPAVLKRIAAYASRNQEKCSKAEPIKANHAKAPAEFWEQVALHRKVIEAYAQKFSSQHITPDDLLSESLFKAGRSYRSVEGGVTSFPAWMKRIIANTSGDVFRSAHVRHRADVEDHVLEEVIGSPDHGFSFFGGAISPSELVSAVGKVNAELLILRAEDHSFEEIAYGLQCTRPAAKSRYFKALKIAQQLIPTENELIA